MRKYILFFSALALMIFAACEQQQEGQAEEMTEDTTVTEETTQEKDRSMTDAVMEKNGLKVYPKTNSPRFEMAALETTVPVGGESVEPGEVKFMYNLTNYELGVQTKNAEGLANSADGQHIHAILNNNPYMAKYEPMFTTELEKGHYVLLSFLSRSYHESVKDDGAYDLIQFSVGDVEADQADLDAPHIFYSRPKGTYTGEDTKKLLLDWYLVNCDLSPDGYKVKATVNDTEFMFDQWKPYIIEGLPMGEVNIKLELMDADGNLVESPFNPVERTVTLAAAE